MQKSIRPKDFNFFFCWKGLLYSSNSVGTSVTAGVVSTIVGVSTIFTTSVLTVTLGFGVLFVSSDALVPALAFCASPCFLINATNLSPIYEFSCNRREKKFQSS